MVAQAVNQERGAPLELGLVYTEERRHGAGREAGGEVGWLTRGLGLEVHEGSLEGEMRSGVGLGIRPHSRGEPLAPIGAGKGL
jgi:hypothetical protein